MHPISAINLWVLSSVAFQALCWPKRVYNLDQPQDNYIVKLWVDKARIYVPQDCITINAYTLLAYIAIL